MIHTLSMNPAVDRTVSIPRFRLDAVNRVAETRSDPGGKGVNVSKVLKTLRAPALTHLCAGGEAGAWLCEALRQRGLDLVVCPIEGLTRTNIKVVDPVEGTFTDINEAGPRLSPRELEALERGLLDRVHPGDVVVLSGSLPGGVDPGHYRYLIRETQDRGGLCILDADGPALAAGLEAGPHLVKPNLHELERLVAPGGPGSLDSPAKAARAARDLMERYGVARMVVSLGAQGALFLEAQRGFQAQGIKVEAKSTVGAGDALVAALAAGIAAAAPEIPPLEDLMGLAIATATAAVINPGTQGPRREDIEAFRPRVTGVPL